MSISQKLSWEIVALNDRGDASDNEQLAAEICYGVSLAHDDKEPFLRTMNAIMEQVTDQELRRHLALYTARGVRK